MGDIQLQRGALQEPRATLSFLDSTSQELQNDRLQDQTLHWLRCFGRKAKIVRFSVEETGSKGTERARSRECEEITSPKSLHCLARCRECSRKTPESSARREEGRKALFLHNRRTLQSGALGPCLPLAHLLPQSRY